MSLLSYGACVQLNRSSRGVAPKFGVYRLASEAYFRFTCTPGSHDLPSRRRHRTYRCYDTSVILSHPCRGELGMVRSRADAPEFRLLWCWLDSIFSGGSAIQHIIRSPDGNSGTDGCHANSVFCERIAGAALHPFDGLQSDFWDRAYPCKLEDPTFPSREIT